MTRWVVGLALAAIAFAVGFTPVPTPSSPLSSAHAGRNLVHGLPLPPRTRSRADNLFVSGQSLRATVDFYRRHLNRRGIRHRAIPIYRYRGVTVARFLSQTPGSQWNALHVFQSAGETAIFILPRSARSGRPAPRP